jgi:hypothetical protein
MSTTERPMRITKLCEQGKEGDLKDASPAECLDMMWQLALDAWAMQGDCDAESRLPRHVGRVVRRER